MFVLVLRLRRPKGQRNAFAFSCLSDSLLVRLPVILQIMSHTRRLPGSPGRGNIVPREQCADSKKDGGDGA